MVVKSDKPDPTAPPDPPEKPVPNGGIEEPDDQVSTEGGSPVKTEADQRTANDAAASAHSGCGMMWKVFKILKLLVYTSR